ncbi:MAG TPA: 30S ribosomal protein S16 [Thermoanaerobaculia bacterium]|nr:30S ribosomal protein S16 [Thermoanaerobaculia bacterium]
MLKIRLRRMGARHRPFYRVVVSDSRNVPTASAVEELGHYDPTTNPAQVKLDAERVRYWVGQGAQLSPTVKKLLGRAQKSA